MITLATIKAIASGSTAIQALTGSEPVIALIIAEVEKVCTLAVFRAQLFEAQNYLAAHLLTMALGSPYGKGQTTSQSVGGVSISGGIAWQTSKSALGSTAYGQRYLELRRSAMPHFMVVRPGG